MATIEELALRASKGIQNSIDGIPGELGKLESTGSYTVPTGQTNEVYVRLYGDKNQTVTAINLTTKIQARLPVRVKFNSSKRYEVIGLDPLKVGEFLGADAPGANIPPSRGANVDAIWESYQFNPGRISALNGSDLVVYMQSLPYGNSDLGGVSGDMTTVVGTITASKKAWVLVSVNPSTNVLSFTKGTEYALPVPVGTRTYATAVTTPSGDIPLWCYLMRAGDTYIPVQSRSPDALHFVDRRPWIDITPAPVASGTYFPISITTSMSIGSNEQIVVGQFTVGSSGRLTVSGRVTIV